MELECDSPTGKSCPNEFIEAVVTRGDVDQTREDEADLKKKREIVLSQRTRAFGYLLKK